ncbi:hypothetical protein [Nostoc sp.]
MAPGQWPGVVFVRDAHRSSQRFLASNFHQLANEAVSQSWKLPQRAAPRPAAADCVQKHRAIDEGCRKLSAM